MTTLKSIGLLAILTFALGICVSAQNVTVSPGAGSYATLAASFDAINAGTHTGAITVGIVGDTAETAVATLNSSGTGSANYTSVVVKPSGGARTISGTSASNNGLINLNGVDNLTIDGSLSGGNDRSLTITNNEPTDSIVIWMKSVSASNGSNNNTVKNCIINGAPGPNSRTVAGILTGSGITLGNDAEAPNSNNTIRNNWIYRVQNSLYLRGGTGANADLNWAVVDNELGSTVPDDKNIFRGMFIGNSENFTISGNLIHGVQGAAAGVGGQAMRGIQVGQVVQNGTITNNIIHDIKNAATLGEGAYGLMVNSTSAASNVTFANNIFYDISGVTAGSVAYGINVNGPGSSGWKFYHNSINMNTNQTSGTTAAFHVEFTVVAGAIDLRNNILANTQTSGATRFAIHCATSSTAFFNSIDFNDYFSTQNVGTLGGVVRVTLADWQAATGQDANSKAVDPLFVLATDLHLQGTSPMINMGTPILGITTDIDGQTRDATPDIGADEVVALPRRSPFDFDGDGKTDIGIFRPSVAEWWINRSSTGVTFATQFGASTDLITPGDFTGDGKTDIAFWRPSTGEWYILRSEDLSFFAFPFGTTGDIPAPADFDNDGKADPTIFRPSNATWFIQRSSDNGTTIQQFGANGDHPVAADYDGDGRADLAIYRPSLGQWWLNRSTAGVIAMTFGNSTDKAVQGDYTGDGKADVAFWRPSTGEWYILRSENMSFYSVPFGAATDIPAPGDYDGDSKFDTTVFRPSQATWFIQRSTAGTLIQQFGSTGDRPIPNAFVP
jgi:hypothetical protein